MHANFVTYIGARERGETARGAEPGADHLEGNPA
jgi:hypothetical protein